MNNVGLNLNKERGARLIIDLQINLKKGVVSPSSLDMHPPPPPLHGCVFPKIPIHPCPISTLSPPTSCKSLKLVSLFFLNI